MFMINLGIMILSTAFATFVSTSSLALDVDIRILGLYLSKQE